MIPHLLGEFLLLLEPLLTSLFELEILRWLLQLITAYKRGDLQFLQHTCIVEVADVPVLRETINGVGYQRSRGVLS